MRFTTNAYPREQRQDAWRFALQRVSLEVLGTAEELYGELVSFTSGQGIQFVRVTGNGQRLAIDMAQDAPSFWLVLLLEGRLGATQGTTAIELSEGDILYGGGSARTQIDLNGEHRFLLVKVPHALPALRSRSALPSQISNLIADEAIGRMLSALLRSVADTIVDVSDDQIRPVELALPEFIAATLLDKAPVKELGGAAGARAAILERVFQSIEMRLSDPNLSIHQIAAEHRISPRYLQKLFESAGESFSQFVKFRRLERCRLDLGSPLHAQRSISEILFQWGFNDSASFSRAFRERYGMSPREYRKVGALPDEAIEAPRRGRPSAQKDARPEEREEAPAATTLDPAVEADGLVEDVQVDAAPGVRHHVLPVRPDTIHWGYFSKHLKPALEVCSGDYVTVETLTHHANDDAERMIHGDPAAEAVYRWTAEGKVVDRRGAGPLDASVLGRGPGEGFGVHICTGPIAISGAEPGDVVQVRILDIDPRPSRNPRFAGRAFGSNVAAYWGFHYAELITEPKPREVITIYEIEKGAGLPLAHAVYNYRWTPQKDPSGVIHPMYDYPGVPVDPETIEKNFNVLRDIEIPVRPHFGVVALAPAHADLVDSVPPANFGGNIPGRWRTVRHGDRMLDDRRDPGDSAQGQGRAGPRARTGLSDDRNAQRIRDPGLFQPRLPARSGRQGAERGLQAIIDRCRDARRFPQGAALSHDHPRPDRGRGDLALVGRRGFRDQPGRQWQLGCACGDPQGAVHQLIAGCGARQGSGTPDQVRGDVERHSFRHRLPGLDPGSRCLPSRRCGYPFDHSSNTGSAAIASV